MRNATILIVEDDAILAMNLRRMISLMGYTVAGPFASGEVAIAFLAENSVDLVLMDIELAGTMNGITAAETINRISDIPVVFLTGFSNESLLEQAKVAAPYGYLIKPTSERELTATITMSLHRHDLDRKLKETRIALEKSEAQNRHLMEAALKESNDRFRILFENHSAVKLVLDADTGHIVDANNAAVLFYGWPKEILKKMSIDDINTLPVDTVKAEMENALKCKRLRFEFCHRKADGSICEVEVFSNKIEMAGKSYLYSIIHDITDRKNAEKALRESEADKREQDVLRISEARFREVLEHSLDASYKRNLQTDTYDYLSPVFARLSGYTTEEMMTLPIEAVLGLIHIDDLPEIERVLSNAMSELAEKPFHLEYRFRHKDGQYWWFHDRLTIVRDAKGHPLARIGSVSDITDRKLAEENQQKIMREQQTILETANVGISMMVDRKQLWVNRKTVDLFQYSKKELEGHTTRKLYPTQEAYEQLGREAYPTLLLGHLYETEQKLIRRDGTPIWVKYNGKAVEPNDLSKGTIWILEDITERKRTEKELLEMHGDLERKVLERTAALEKTNTTLAMMLDYAHKTETDIQERVVSNLRSNILSIVDMLKQQPLTTNTLELVGLLETTTYNLAHPFARNLESQLLKLTTREIQLANFIRLGKSTKELMVLLDLSARTVESHRNNLRKKLGLNNKKINLRTYLNSKFLN